MNISDKAKHIPFFIIITAIFLGIISPFMLSDGMFMDGLLYAAISNNMAHGMGNAWDLFLTNTFYPHFHEHPPLAFVFQSTLFKLFGDSILIERFYSLSTFGITAFVMVKIWKETVSEKYKNLSWLPLLFWITIPLMSWAAPNNMLENTMMIFTSLSVLFIIKSYKSNSILNLSLSGIMIFLAVLTKGLVALFPFALIFWIFVFNKQFGFLRFSRDILISLSAMILSFIAIFIFMPESYDSLMAYFNKQILGSIENAQTVDSRFFIVFRLFKELIPSLIIILIIKFPSRKQKTKNNSDWAKILLLLGLSGVLPIMISMKQSGFYVLATFPIFSIALALVAAPKFSVLTEMINPQSSKFKAFKYISYTLLLISIVLLFSKVNTIGRDKDEIEDIYSMIEIIPKNTTIGIQKEIRTEWSMHGYFQRYGNIALDTHISDQTNFLILQKNSKEIVNDFIIADSNLRKYTLYKRK
jgi:4-amino-4-deoxy-L-arabinose transferase-like glycosyltransferase